MSVPRVLLVGGNVRQHHLLVVPTERQVEVAADTGDAPGLPRAPFFQQKVVTIRRGRARPFPAPDCRCRSGGFEPRDHVRERGRIGRRPYLAVNTSVILGANGYGVATVAGSHPRGDLVNGGRREIGERP